MTDELAPIFEPLYVVTATHEGRVKEALAAIGYRMGRCGVTVDEWNAVMASASSAADWDEVRDAEEAQAIRQGFYVVPDEVDPHDFEVVFTLRGEERRVPVRVP